MKCMCRSSESATARTSVSSCSHAPMSQRYWRWYTGTTTLRSLESHEIVLTAVASTFVASLLTVTILLA